MSRGNQTSAHLWNMDSHAIAAKAVPSTHSPPAARLMVRPSPKVLPWPLYFVLSWRPPPSGGKDVFAHASPTVLVLPISAIIIALAAAAASAVGTPAGRSEIWDGMVVCGVALHAVLIGFRLLRVGGLGGGGGWTDGRMGGG